MSSISQSKLNLTMPVLRDRVANPAAFWLVAGSCGISAALLLVLVHPSLRIPGSALLRATIPLALGCFLSKERNLGLAMSLFAAGTMLAVSFFGIAFKISPAAALLAIGPLLDLASRLTCRLPKLAILAFGVAGGLANSIAFLIRANIINSLLGEDHQIQSFGVVVFMSFVMCGVLSGLICGLTSETNRQTVN